MNSSALISRCDDDQIAFISVLKSLNLLISMADFATINIDVPQSVSSSIHRIWSILQWKPI